jgi:hypothetical protein
MSVTLAVAAARPTRYTVPPLLLRDLAVIGLLTEDRPSAWYKLERAVGRDFAARLLDVRQAPRLY